ncbi:MAG TPA: type II secretion system protein GspC [Polyangia bacterium]|jgi:general secretion pathway protein C|nr:type II secretion system protein GspC [Polyangia bacterium]
MDTFLKRYLWIFNLANLICANPAQERARPEEAQGSLSRRARCTGTPYEIERALIDRLLSDPTALATAARFVPWIGDGRPRGFRLYQIRPGSIFDRLGLRNGDRVETVNGMEMNTPDQALDVYTKVRSASHLTIVVERQGKTVTLDYAIR